MLLDFSLSLKQIKKYKKIFIIKVIYEENHFACIHTYCNHYV